MRATWVRTAKTRSGTYSLWSDADGVHPSAIGAGFSVNGWTRSEASADALGDGGEYPTLSVAAGFQRALAGLPPSKYNSAIS